MQRNISMYFDEFLMGTHNSHLTQALGPCTSDNFDLNEGFGLEDLSEEGIEACNKLIRRYRERLYQKFSFEGNIKDIFIGYFPLLY